MRETLGYYPTFDAKVEELVSNRRAYVVNELEKLTANSDFPQIHLETELLLDHAWQIRQWDLGMEECERLLEAISKIETQDNPDIVVQSIAVLKDKIKRCESLFRFMNGKIDNSDMEISKSELISSYDTPRYTLFWCVSRIYEDEDATDTEKMKEIMQETEIELRFC